jgi:threonine aldolase
MKGFASDNNAGVHSAILQAIETANQEHAIGYGEDEYTQRAIKLFHALFQTEVDVYFVFTGTAANVLSFSTLCQPFHSIICSDTAHVNVDECGAPERFTGSKIISIPAKNGKLHPDIIKPYLKGFGEQHHSQPGMISITQASEMGTVYKPDEIVAIANMAHENGMYLHMDGARIANAVVSLNTNINAITRNAGVDVLSFGGTKNGMMFGEAVVFFNPELSKNFKFHRKQAMQLYSKMRFVSAQFVEYLENDLWLKNARHSNQMAQFMAAKIKDIPQIQITQPVEANGIFARVPQEIIEPLRNEYYFYDWDELNSEVRWMCSFDTTQQDVDGFLGTLKKLLQAHSL